MQGGKFGKPTSQEPLVFFASEVAVGGVGVEDVAVAGFEEAEDAGFVYYTGTMVVVLDVEEYALQ